MKTFGCRRLRVFTSLKGGWKQTGFYLVGMFLLWGLSPHASVANPADVPTINGGMGSCTADFTVVDAQNKPIYDAKIHLKVKYGFMSKKDTDLEIGTDSNGKARFEGLPEKLKKPPMEFTVASGTMNKSVTNDPATNCHATFAVTLGN